MTQQTLDQYKEEYKRNREVDAFLFGGGPYSDYIAHLNAASEIAIMNLLPVPEPEALRALLDRIEWHTSEAEALRKSGFKDG